MIPFTPLSHPPSQFLPSCVSEYHSLKYYSPANSPAPALLSSVVHPVVDSLIHPVADSFIDSLIDSLVCPLVHPLVHPVFHRYIFVHYSVRHTDPHSNALKRPDAHALDFGEHLRDGRVLLSFFHNTGAVAGVFAVVGLVVLAIAIALITNAVRRRRAKKFDRDVALAAAEAAANARSPDFGVDDDGYGYGAGSAAADGSRSVYTGYSDASHGTYAQQPLTGAESYGMSDLHNFDPAKSATQPYNAFAGPQVDPYAPPVVQTATYDAPGQQGQLRYRQRGTSGNSQDLLDAAGLTGTGGLARGPSQSYAPQQQRSYQPSFPQPEPSQQQQQYRSSPPQRVVSMAEDDDPYDGIDSGNNDGLGTMNMSLANPYSPSASVHIQAGERYSSSEEGGDAYPEPEYGKEENRLSLRDEEDYAYGGGKRVLKVANE
ncbi:hypothetical protein EUX98_g6844 [Antrodiella citrinella]|uniref:Uncharacterized protein n=1 Tax=Antrodiella citrinella TaxID=2447956 RepID=A0A4S4MN02_9APHY|nr:hypothetical protein EUX98_g6844 [Antrodiella citrinella]